MTFEIEPGAAVGPLHFGMSIRNARAALAEPLKALGRGWAIQRSFLKDARRDGVPVDDVADLGLHLHYRVRGERVVLVAVEMFPPAAPVLRGVSLLADSFASVKELLLRLDPTALTEDSEVRSLALGVAVAGPAGDEPDAPAGSAFAFEPGYWDVPLAPAVPRA
ncbi:MAG TPA: hypothetical protein VIF57_23400 [Polyangia bacterium]|jgi:hypothetical protein